MTEALENQVSKAEASMDVYALKTQVNLIQHVMKEVMKKGVHYGTIPGCGDKPTLLKPGAEKIGMTFKLAPRYDIVEKNLPGNHREYRVTAIFTHSPTQTFLGEGVGVCSTMEGKFRFRNSARVCPACETECIIKGKAQYGGGWLCYTKKGGCGAKYQDGDEAIEGQQTGKAEHDNPADYYNTVLKMGKKRAQVDGILTVTAASDIFTQDIEDMPEVIPGAAKAQEPKPESNQKQSEPPPEERDSSSQGEEPPPENGSDSPLIDVHQLKKFHTIATNKGWSDTAKDALVAEFGFESSKDITVDKFPDMLTILWKGMEQ